MDLILVSVNIVLLLAFLYVVYLGVRQAAKRLAESKDFRSVLDVEVKESSQKLKLRIRDWFVWNVSVNEEKGTAGGNIKINFPIKSSLLLGIIFLVLTFTIGMVTRYVIPAIFLCFSIYHFRQWYRSLAILRNSESAASDPASVTDGDGVVIVRYRDCIGLAATLYSRNFLKLLPLIIVAYVLTLVSVGLLGGVLIGGIFLALSNSLETEDFVVNLRDLLVPRRLAIRITVIFFISVPCVFAGLAALFIPGLFIGSAAQYSLLFAILRGTTISESFIAGYQLARANWKLNIPVFLTVLLCNAAIVSDSNGWFLWPFTAPLGLALVAATFHAQTSAKCFGLGGYIPPKTESEQT